VLLFKDRQDAGRRLAEALPLRGTHPLIMAIPRGGVAVGEALSAALNGDLDVVLVRKLRHPSEPELALGAVGEGQVPVWNSLSGPMDADNAWLIQELALQRAELAQRRALYTPRAGPLNPERRITIAVDDGAATGATLIAALRLLRRRRPSRLIAAAAVAPPETVQRLQREADQVVVLWAPREFQSVGEAFEDFHQLTDDEVIAALQRARRQAHL
jgi:predicted phosphoribosyltransferase